VSGHDDQTKQPFLRFYNHDNDNDTDNDNDNPGNRINVYVMKNVIILVATGRATTGPRSKSDANKN
jgi:hypothetical protein